MTDWNFDLTWYHGSQQELTTLRATHQGTLWGFIPPTGKQVEWPGIHIVRVDEGKIVEVRAVANQATILQQLGVRLLPPDDDA